MRIHFTQKSIKKTYFSSLKLSHSALSLRKYVPAQLLCMHIYTTTLCSHDMFKTEGLFMKDLLPYLFTKDLSQHKQEFNILKGFEFCDCVLLISKWLFVLSIF